MAERDVVVTVTIEGRSSAHHAQQHATAGGQVTGCPRETVTRGQPPASSTETAQPPPAATTARARARRPHPPQSDLLFLDEPAPGLDHLAVDPGRALVIVFGTRDCVLPLINGAQLVRCSDPALASRYAMTTSAGRIGPGYAVVDAAGQLRYLTHDMAPGTRSERIQILLNALDGLKVRR